MNVLPALLAVLLVTAAPSENSVPANWSVWRSLPVQNGGRMKPLDTLSWETLRLIANRASLQDPSSGASCDATSAYMMMIFDWTGWENPQHDQMLLNSDWRRMYYTLHQADKWDNAPLLRLDFLELRSDLGLPSDQTHVSPWQLTQAFMEHPSTNQRVLFITLADELLQKEAQNKTLSKYEKKILELANKLWTYQNHRMGRDLEILPIDGSPTNAWMPMAHLLLTTFDDSNDSTGQYRKAKTLLLQARSAYNRGDAGAFDGYAADLVATLKAAQDDLGSTVNTSRINLEVAYNHWAPFRIAWIGMLASLLAMLLHLGTSWSSLKWGSFACYGIGMAAMLSGFTMRILISGRPPVTNMYESIIWVSLGTTFFGLILTLIYRVNFILLAASAVSTVGLMLGDNSPTILDPSLQPLEPVLRSNFWLVIHVMTITLSYAAFALALGISNITLGYFFFRSQNRSVISALNRFTYKALQIGVLLLAAGTILGGVWADYSWGRFWGWDPKEVWALVALLGYLSVLHARYAGWVGQRGLPSLAVACFVLVVMAWYGVNFVLGAGLHSYGFGDGGQPYVYTCILIQLAYMGLALYRSRPEVQPAPEVNPGLALA